MPRHPHHPANVKCATNAKSALCVYTRKTYGRRHPDNMHRGDLETAVQDLVGDLLHFWTQRRKPKDRTPLDIVNRAFIVFDDELYRPDF